MKKILLFISLFIGLSINLLAYNYGTIEKNTIGCEKGQALSCSNLGSNYLSKDNKELAKFYYTKGTKLFKKYCEEGNGKACFDLADRFHGTLFSIDSNLSAVAKYYHKACNNKYGKGCIELGAGYKRGRISLKKDKEKSLEYYAKGVKYLNHECDNNIAASCKDLSLIYSIEMYDTNDRKKGLELQKKTFNLYKELCTKKDDEGCIQTAFAYHRGIKEVVIIDWIKAKEYYKKSCEYGQTSACIRGKRLDVSKQLQFEKDRELNYYIESVLRQEQQEGKKWKDRLQKYKDKLNNRDITKEETKEILKKIKLEKMTWREKYNKMLEYRKKLISKKKQELGLK